MRVRWRDNPLPPVAPARQLPFYGHQFLVVEKRVRAEAGTVHDDWLGERHQVAGRVERADDNAAAGLEEIAHQRVKVDGRLDGERQRSGGIFRRERMLARTEQLARSVRTQRVG